MFIQQLMNSRHCGRQDVEGFKHKLGKISEKVMAPTRSAIT